MKKIYRILSLYAAILFFVLILFSCGKTDDTNYQIPNGGETISIAKAESLKVRPGKNRVELSWIFTDSQIKGCKVFYNSRKDSIEKKVSKTQEIDTVRLIIGDLAEGTHSFRVFNYDDKGNRSLHSDISGKVYGSMYQSSLQDADFSEYYLDNDELKIRWNDFQRDDFVGIGLEYTNLDGSIVGKHVTDLGDTCVLSDFPMNGMFRYRSLFIPEPSAIDTFYTNFQQFTPFEKVTVKPETFIGLIQQKTDLVGSIQKNITYSISNGLTFTEIEYLNQINAPMAMYILGADFERNASLRATAAKKGEELNAKETVRKQTEYMKEMNYDVIAAVNGDYWRVNETEDEKTPMGQTYGPLFMNGIMKKDLTRSTQYYYAAVLKNGMLTMGDKEHYSNYRNRIQEAIGGRYLLVKDGENVSGLISNKDTAPRTTIGEFSPFQAVFIVIDGRRPSHSQGVTLQQLGLIYEAIGVKTAINLDGGGSTTLFVKNNDNNELTLKNKPSDDKERAVANAWCIVKIE